MARNAAAHLAALALVAGLPMSRAPLPYRHVRSISADERRRRTKAKKAAKAHRRQHGR